MKKVMIVDDRPEVSQLAHYLLKDRYELICHDDAVAALEDLHSRPVDLVILDYKMPVLNGYEFLVKFREISDIPVVVCSASKLNYEKFAGQGVVRIMIKPFGIEEFRDVIGGILDPVNF